MDLLVSTVSQSHSLPTALHSDTIGTQPLVGVCELKGKMRDFSSLCKRFAAIMTRCEAEEWTAYGKVLGELGGVEAKVDGWITSVRSDDFQEKDCARELGRQVHGLLQSWPNAIAYMPTVSPRNSVISLLLLSRDQSSTSRNSNLHSRTLSTTTSTTLLRRSVSPAKLCMFLPRKAVRPLGHCVISKGALMYPDIEVDVGESSLEVGVYEPVQRIMDQVRAVKVPSG